MSDETYRRSWARRRSRERRGARVGQEPFLAADEEDEIELEPLAPWSVESVTTSRASSSVSLKSSVSSVKERGEALRRIAPLRQLALLPPREEGASMPSTFAHRRAAGRTDGDVASISSLIPTRSHSARATSLGFTRSAEELPSRLADELLERACTRRARGRTRRRARRPARPLATASIPARARACASFSSARRRRSRAADSS